MITQVRPHTKNWTDSNGKKTVKPDWKDAPAWAKYLAHDANSQFYWFETTPVILYPGDDHWTYRGRCEG
ncbi:hypothetical protein [Xanthomonas oryzae]|uniref:hypothetical protein n=1 Tax=Xanthomonas oryzae TaxID=347 RepID=UPI003DA1C704